MWRTRGHAEVYWVLSSFGRLANRPERADNRRKTTRWRKDNFSLALDRVLGESRFATTRNSRFTPECTARLWRGLLFVDFAFLLKLYKATRGNRAAWGRSVNLSLIRVEPNFG